MSVTQISASQRIPVVDFLRGLVLLGVAASNYMNFQQAGIAQTGINKYLDAAENIFFGPVWISLSFLFGFGFWSLIEKLKSQRQKIIPAFLKRMFWLFLIGVFNSFFYYGDILRDFAVMGIFLLLFLNMEKKTLLTIASVLTVFIPLVAAFTLQSGFYHRHDWFELHHLFESQNWKDAIQYNFMRLKLHQIENPYYLVSVHFEMLVFFLWGILSFRFNLFQEQTRTKIYAKYLFLISFAGVSIAWGTDNFFELKMINLYFQINVLLEMLYAMLIISIGCFIFLFGFLPKLTEAIKIYGRMTLSNYIFQNMISFLLFSGAGFAIGLKQPLWVYFFIAVLVYLSQIFISLIWFRKFSLGPFEWIWRSLSSGRILPMKPE